MYVVVSEALLRVLIIIILIFTHISFYKFVLYLLCFFVAHLNDYVNNHYSTILEDLRTERN